LRKGHGARGGARGAPPRLKQELAPWPKPEPGLGLETVPEGAPDISRAWGEAGDPGQGKNLWESLGKTGKIKKQNGKMKTGKKSNARKPCGTGQLTGNS
jgi:hypothetical protein